MALESAKWKVKVVVHRQGFDSSLKAANDWLHSVNKQPQSILVFGLLLCVVSLILKT